jgi:hypothetical protein
MFSASALIALALVPAGLFSIDGSGVARTETRAVAGFTDVDLQGHATLQIVVGKDASVTVSGDDNLVPLVETIVRDKMLVIGWKGKRSGDAKLPLVVRVTVPTLMSTLVSGAGAATIVGVAGASFFANVTGAGSLTVSGTVTAFNAGLSGAGSIDAEKLAAKIVAVNVSGAGSVVVAPEDALDARVSGVGSIRYVGEPPKLKRTVTGIGSIRPK